MFWTLYLSMSTEVTFEERVQKLCLLMEEGRNQTRSKEPLLSDVGMNRIAKYCLVHTHVYRDENEEIFVSRTVGMICLFLP